jgi:hypothetical protein
VLAFPLSTDEAAEILASIFKVFAKILFEAAVDGDFSQEKKSEGHAVFNAINLTNLN